MDSTTSVIAAAMRCGGRPIVISGSANAGTLQNGDIQSRVGLVGRIETCIGEIDQY